MASRMKSGPTPLALKRLVGGRQPISAMVSPRRGGRKRMQPDDRLDTAVVLAGGLGTRLGTVTATVPKPLVRVKGRPYLEHQLELLKRHRVTKIILLTGYRGDQIEEHFAAGESLGLSISYS